MNLMDGVVVPADAALGPAHRVDGKKILSSSPEIGSMSILICLSEVFFRKNGDDY